jgi:pyruvate dehydrogenase E2 component (dihydrolipoamide acetyltransferase)
VKPEDPLITLESDKAAMEVPAPQAGKVAEVLVKVGDKVSEGSAILRLASADAAATSSSAPASNNASKPPPTEQAPEREARSHQDDALPSLREPAENATPVGDDASDDTDGAQLRVPLPLQSDFGGVHAGPSVRRLARELDIDLRRITGTGKKGLITKEDVKRAVAQISGGGIPEIPVQDFAKFGPVETRPMTRLERLAGPHLHRAWLNIPHVTHRDEADISDLDEYRKSLDASAKEKGYRVTLLAFLMKASVVALKEYPDFNASLGPDKQSLILKRYYHLGIAVDTKDGLVVPVIRDVDRKGILELSQELHDVSQRMREGKITPNDIQGGTFSISSLGGIGGTSFTPIVNAPEVAILGVARSSTTAHWDGARFVPRLMLPLCLSYDHRVIDGAKAARFARRLAEILGDVRQLVL